jgi:hypothetical protein
VNAGLTGGVGIGRKCPRWCGAPTNDFAGLVARSREREGEIGEEVEAV